jgi:hypothetical protein
MMNEEDSTALKIYIIYEQQNIQVHEDYLIRNRCCHNTYLAILIILLCEHVPYVGNPAVQTGAVELAVLIFGCTNSRTARVIT